MREQRGYVFRKGDSWFVRYRDQIVEDGRLVRKQICKKIEPVAKEHERLKRPPDSVLEEAKRMLAPLNNTTDVSGNLRLKDFVKMVWLPAVESRCAASTQHVYVYYWERILKPRCGDALLRDFGTPHAQKLMNDLGRQNGEMKKATLHKLKSMLASIFKLAIQQGYRPGPNPVRETSLPRAQDSSETYAYSLAEIVWMIQNVPEPARTPIAIAAFAGLRRSELQGLQWESYDGATLKVLRSVWEGHVGEPKSKKSKAAVPVVAPLRALLDQHRMRAGQPEAGIMFKTANGTPIAMNNLLGDQIKPVLNRCGICRKGEAEHSRSDHEYQRDPSAPAWHGWHAFRRGLATNLHDLGVDDLTIQRILRHSDVSVTQRCYIKTLPEQSIAAMKKLEQLVGKSIAISALCNDCATAPPTPGLLQ
jgi:integrase